MASKKRVTNDCWTPEQKWCSRCRGTGVGYACACDKCEGRGWLYRDKKREQQYQDQLRADWEQRRKENEMEEGKTKSSSKTRPDEPRPEGDPPSQRIIECLYKGCHNNTVVESVGNVGYLCPEHEKTDSSLWRTPGRISAVEGLLRLAYNKCCYCDDVQVTPAVLKDGKWIHPAGGFLKGEVDCASGDIHDQIAASEKSSGTKVVVSPDAKAARDLADLIGIQHKHGAILGWSYGEAVRIIHEHLKAVRTECTAKASDEANIGKAFFAMLPKDYAWGICPTEYVTQLTDERDEAKTEIDRLKNELRMALKAVEAFEMPSPVKKIIRIEKSRERQIKKRLKERKARYEMQGLVLDRLASIDKKLDVALNPHFDA